MDKAERKRLKQQGKELVERQSQEQRAKLRAENPWMAGGPEWIKQHKEANRLKQENVARRKKLYPIPAWAARGRISSHIYISGRDQASQYDSSPERFPDRAERSQITPLELTGLWALVRGIEWKEVMVDGFEQILEEDGGRRVIHQLPGEMVRDLANVTPETIAALTVKWADRERFAWRKDTTQRVIEELVRLATLATRRNLNLYLRICF